MIEDILNKTINKPFAEKVNIYNQISKELFEYIGLNHPALNVQLVPIDNVIANDYNPNKVAPPEMESLKLSIKRDGLTMPVVVAPQKNGQHIVVDGFHRRTISKSSKEINESLNGYLPISILHKDIQDRIASTVRHNMARGTHQVELSANLIVMLKKHNWSNERIGKELGMEADEVLRLKQVTGLAEAFSDKEFSKSWEVSK